MDYNKLIDAIKLCGSEPSVRQREKKCAYYKGADTKKCIPKMTKDCASAIADLLIENQSLRNAANGFKAQAEEAEARADNTEKIASDLCDDFTDFVTRGIHNAAPYCANCCQECVDARGWCKEGGKACRGFYPKAAMGSED